MENNNSMLARVAGVHYLILIVAGLFGMVYVPAVVFDWSNPAGTAARLGASPLLFNVGIVACMVSYLAFAVASVFLQRLFVREHPLLALLLLCFGWLGSGCLLANLLHYVEIYGLVASAVASPGQPEAVGQAILSAATNFNNGFKVMQVITGLWLVILGILLLKSELLPRILGMLLVISGVVNYVGSTFVEFVLGYAGLPGWLTLPGTLGEFTACLWLLLAGTVWQKRRRAGHLSVLS